MNLNEFETKLNTNEHSKDEVRKLLNYALYLKEQNSDLHSKNMDLEDEVRLWKSNCNVY